MQGRRFEIIKKTGDEACVSVFIHLLRMRPRPVVLRGPTHILTICRMIVYFNCSGWDSNPHTLRHTNLNRTCIPNSTTWAVWTSFTIVIHKSNTRWFYLLYHVHGTLWSFAPWLQGGYEKQIGNQKNRP